MKILARVHLYPPDHNAGAELMLHELLKALVKRGHSCEVHLSRTSRSRRPYARDGVVVFPNGSSEWMDAAAESDVILTHLDNTHKLVNVAIALKKPLVQVLHNTHPATRMWANCKNDLLVYNSLWMQKTLGDHENGIVVRPPVFADDYATDGEHDKVTLINLSYNKGGVRFAQLAATMPRTPFLGVAGAYGEQIDPFLDNVEIQQHTPDIKSVYGRTRLLLMPSSYESYGRVGVEAMCSGIPVIASDTPGIREALGSAASLLPVRAPLEIWRSEIDFLLGNPEVYEMHAFRAKGRVKKLEDRSLGELENFCERVEKL